MNQSKFANFVVRFSWLFIILFLGVAAFFALQLKKVELDIEMKNQLPPDLPTRLNLDKIEELFGGTDMAMIVISADNILEQKTLERIEKMSKAVERVGELDRVISLFTSKDIISEFGQMTVERTVRALPRYSARRSSTSARWPLASPERTILR